MVYVALTFDDGTLHQYELLTFLYRHNIKATVFCVTHLHRHPDTNKILLVSFPEKIRELYRMGHEIASHTCTHPDLSRIFSDETLERELRESRRKLENIICDEVVGFAYPYSKCNPKAENYVRKIYSYARCGTILNDPLNTLNNNRYKISSIGVKKLLKTIFQIKKIRKGRGTNPIIVIMLHDIGLTTLFSILLFLRIFSPNFLTLREASEILRHRQVRSR